MKTVLITGATSGIGKEAARLAYAEGLQLAVCGRDEDKLQHLQQEIPCFGSTFHLQNEADTIAFFRHTLDHFGVIDALINCAGANTARANGTDIQLADFQDMMEANCIGPFLMMKESAKYFKARGQGTIINVLSTVCLYENVNIGAYAASKRAFEALSKTMRKELRDANVRICHIYPGGVNTPFRMEPNPHYLQAEDVAREIVHILQSDSRICMDDIVLRPWCERNF